MSKLYFVFLQLSVNAQNHS